MASSSSRSFCFNNLSDSACAFSTVVLSCSFCWVMLVNTSYTFCIAYSLKSVISCSNSSLSGSFYSKTCYISPISLSISLSSFSKFYFCLSSALIFSASFGNSFMQLTRYVIYRSFYKILILPLVSSAWLSFISSRWRFSFSSDSVLSFYSSKFLS